MEQHAEYLKGSVSSQVEAIPLGHFLLTINLVTALTWLGVLWLRDDVICTVKVNPSGKSPVQWGTGGGASSTSVVIV